MKPEKLSSITTPKAGVSSSPTSAVWDVFVHANAVRFAGLDTLRENQRLSYEIADDDGRGKGPAAQNIVDLDI